MSVVVDASVACKWFIEEAGSAEAEILLANQDALLAPDLIVPEVGNVMWRKLRTGHMTSAHATTTVEALPGFLDDLCPSLRLGGRALAIAEAIDHPVYDCFYLALAELSECRLVTADNRLLGRLAGTEWEQCATSLYQFTP